MSVSEAKVARLANGNPPRVMDVFSGCGGLSLGFAAAGRSGCICAWSSIDLKPPSRTQPTSTATEDRAAFDAHSRPRDIVQIEPERLMGEQYPASTAVEMVEHPGRWSPCQAFAVFAAPSSERLMSTHRRSPSTLAAICTCDTSSTFANSNHWRTVMENVPEMPRSGGHNIAEELVQVLNGLGYNTRYTLLNSALYGVPQTRDTDVTHRLPGRIRVEPRFPTRRTTPNCQRATVALGLSHSSTLRRACYSITTTRPPLHPGIDCCCGHGGAPIGDLPRITEHLAW